MRTKGTTLSKKKSGSELEDFLVGHLTSIGEIGVESEEIETTDHDSPNDYKEFEAGAKDAGEVAIAGNIKNEQDIEKMLALAEARTKEEWTVTYPSGAKWVFTGFLKSFKDGEKTIGGVATFTGSIRISGKPVYTKGV